MCVHFCSECQWTLYLWQCSSGGRLQSVWRSSGGVHQWSVGDSLSWWLEQCWCQCGLQAAGICNHWKWVQICFHMSFYWICFFSCITGGIPHSSAFFGAGTGPIYLDDVACTSSASQLLECSSRPILRHNCTHSADAGVGCEGNIFWNLKYTVNRCCNSQASIPFCYSSMHNWSVATSRR